MSTLLLSRLDRTARWMKRGGREGDVVLSSRVRLARNLARYAFPHRASQQELAQVRERVLLALQEAAPAAPDSLLVLQLEDYSGVERRSLVDRHLSSREHIRDERGRALVTTADGAFSILINEEDHVRLSGVLPGLQLDAALEMCDEVDDALEEYFDGKSAFAFDPDFGFLTSCPTNAGTGLRASAMLHLPALSLLGELEDAREWANERGFVLRGTTGEGSEVAGHIEQLSNQSTLGQNESDIALEIENAAREIAIREREGRTRLVEEMPIQTRDLVGRAYGILRYARRITGEEATQTLSLLRLGHELGWLKGLSRQRFNELSVWLRPDYLGVLHSRELSRDERALVRADLLRAHVSKVKLEPVFEQLP
ncbi:ATP--guanido phosphotransferase [bacterium]|nr:MAG: ATP--guanido phosphotransferase [bacterium]